MNKEDKNQIFGAVFIVAITIAGYFSYRYFHLRKRAETYGVYVRDNNLASSPLKYFKYKTETGVIYEAPNGYNRYLNIGDTVWIKYSITDPMVIEVLDKDYLKYMKKKE